MTRLFSELKRRNVFRVAVAYAVVGWLLAQIADLALESFGAPDWVMKTLLLLLLIGLPVALILAWAFEITSEGVRRESDVPVGDSITGKTGRKLDYIIIGCLAIALAYFVYESRIEKGAGPQSVVEKSIAVLPFINIGGNVEDDYLSDGLAETLLHLLAQIEEIQVAARTSAFKFKDTNEDIRIIGEQLGVATVLEGSIQRSGDKIRITAQLINVDDGFHLWSGNFDRTINDIFAVQDEIAESVVNALQVTLLGDVQSEGFQDPAAYDALLRIRDDVRSGNSDRLAAAIESLKELIEKYPDYSDAHAALAMAYNLFAFGAGLIPEEYLAKAKTAAEDAIRLGPNVATGHIALARVLTGSQAFVPAEAVVARAMELEPGNADLLVDQAAVLTAHHDFNTALRILERAIRLDPLNHSTRTALAIAFVNTGQNEEAKTTLAEGLESSPNNEALLFALATTSGLAGDYAQAIAIHRELSARAPDLIVLWQSLFLAFIDLGDYEIAHQYLLEIEALSINRAADERAQYCLLIGDRECQYAATRVMIATRDAFFVKLWHARMMLDRDATAEAIALLEPVVRGYDASGAIYGNLQTRVNLAALYHLEGDFENRDLALGKLESMISRGVENGWRSWEPDYYLAAAAAARGEIEAAIPHLDRARENGFRFSNNFSYDFLWDPYQGNAAFQAAKARIMASNAEVLEAIRYTAE